MEEMENDIKEENYKFNKPVGYREEFSEIEDEIYYINNLSNILFIIFFYFKYFIPKYIINMINNMLNILYYI